LVAGGYSSSADFACAKTTGNSTVENVPTKAIFLRYGSGWSRILIDQPDKSTGPKGIRRAGCCHRQNAGGQTFGKGKKDNRGERRSSLRLCSAIEMCGPVASQQ